MKSKIVWLKKWFVEQRSGNVTSLFNRTYHHIVCMSRHMLTFWSRNSDDSNKTSNRMLLGFYLYEKRQLPESFKENLCYAEKTPKNEEKNVKNDEKHHICSDLFSISTPQEALQSELLRALWARTLEWAQFARDLCGLTGLASAGSFSNCNEAKPKKTPKKTNMQTSLDFLGTRAVMTLRPLFLKVFSWSKGFHTKLFTVCCCEVTRWK